MSWQRGHFLVCLMFCHKSYVFYLSSWSGLWRVEIGFSGVARRPDVPSGEVVFLSQHDGRPHRRTRYREGAPCHGSLTGPAVPKVVPGANVPLKPKGKGKATKPVMIKVPCYLTYGTGKITLRAGYGNEIGKDTSGCPWVGTQA
jgi:hypothetical protein